MNLSVLSVILLSVVASVLCMELLGLTISFVFSMETTLFQNFLYGYLSMGGLLACVMIYYDGLRFVKKFSSSPSF